MKRCLFLLIILSFHSIAFADDSYVADPNEFIPHPGINAKVEGPAEDRAGYYHDGFDGSDYQVSPEIIGTEYIHQIRENDTAGTADDGSDPRLIAAGVEEGLALDDKTQDRIVDEFLAENEADAGSGCQLGGGSLVTSSAAGWLLVFAALGLGGRRKSRK